MGKPGWGYHYTPCNPGGKGSGTGAGVIAVAVLVVAAVAAPAAGAAAATAVHVLKAAVVVVVITVVSLAALAVVAVLAWASRRLYWWRRQRRAIMRVAIAPPVAVQAAITAYRHAIEAAPPAVTLTARDYVRSQGER